MKLTFSLVYIVFCLKVLMQYSSSVTKSLRLELIISINIHHTHDLFTEGSSCIHKDHHKYVHMQV